MKLIKSLMKVEFGVSLEKFQEKFRTYLSKDLRNKAKEVWVEV